MSRHHIQPPPIYMPPTPPKPAVRKSGLTRLKQAGLSEETSETDEAEETEESDRIRRKQAFGRQSDSSSSFDVMDRKGRSTNGRLSDVTLKTLLSVQEVGK
jgi:hypothetical protein